LGTGELSPLMFRFGNNHQFEAGYIFGIGVMKDDPYMENLLVLSWLGPKLS
jgi:hypothetical protein